jgi:hypothetical protein
MACRQLPPEYFQKGPTCWAYALVSFNTASLGQPYWPDDVIRTYKQYLLPDESMDPFHWPIVAQEEKLKYLNTHGSTLKREYVRDRLEHSHLYAIEDVGANMSHSYVVYGLGGYHDPYLSVMDPMKGYTWRYLQQLESSKLMLAWRGTP